MSFADTVQPDLHRLEEIQEYEVLGQPASRDLQALADLAAQVCQMSSAAINVITPTEQHQIATTGFDPMTTARSESLCGATLEEHRTVVVPDATRDERFRDNPFVTGVLGHIRAYASAPLITDDGVTLGRLCVFDTEPRPLRPGQADALETIAERVVDVLELRRRGRQLEQSLADLTAVRDELRRSNEQLTLFAGQISHDLRTPLSAILANTELLAQEPAVTADPELGSLVSGAHHAGQRMAAMIDEILASAQLGAELKDGDTDLNQVLGTVLTDLAPRLRDSGARVRVSRLPTVRADPYQLYCVLLNLLGNAVKFARPGVPPVIRVESDVVAGTPRVRVVDNGIGIPKHQHQRVFQLFSRADTAVAGNGIGLTTVKRIVEAYGGRVGLQSVPRSGTTVWFELPR